MQCGINRIRYNIFLDKQMVECISYYLLSAQLNHLQSTVHLHRMSHRYINLLCDVTILNYYVGQFIKYKREIIL